jgi:hypothetical protein
MAVGIPFMEWDRIHYFLHEQPVGNSPAVFGASHPSRCRADMAVERAEARRCA